VSSEVLQQLDLSQRPLSQDLLAEDICDLLDSNTLACLVVGRCDHDAVRSLTKLLGHSVALIDNEVLVEDLEHLTALQRRVGHGDVVVVAKEVDLLEMRRDEARFASIRMPREGRNVGRKVLSLLLVSDTSFSSTSPDTMFELYYGLRRARASCSGEGGGVGPWRQ